MGTVPELAPRNLRRFHAEGLVKLEGKNAVVPNLAALEAELGSRE